MKSIIMIGLLVGKEYYFGYRCAYYLFSCKGELFTISFV